MSRLTVAAFILTIAAQAAAQSADTSVSVVGPMSPEEMLAEIDRRAGSASGYDALLQDPDPRRSAAAVALMMESGNENLIRKALDFGLASPEPGIRSTALTSYLKTLPTLALDFDGAAVEDESLRQLGENVRDWGGSLGPNKKGSFSVALGAWSDELQCYVQVQDEKSCSARINAQSLSLMVADQWVNLNPNQEGNLEGGFNVPTKNGHYPVGPLKVTVRLVE